MTIPVDIRHHLGLQPGDEVEFVLEDDVVYVRRAAGSSSRGRRVVDHLRSHRPDVPMSTDDIMALTRGD